MTRDAYSVLVADRNPGFEASLRLPLTVARTGESARAALLDSKRGLAAILLHPSISSPGLLPLVSLARRTRPATPLYFVYDGQSPLGRDQLDRIGVLDSFRRDEVVANLANRLSPEVFQIPSQAFVSGARAADLAARANALEENYVPVPVADFLAGTPCFFDVYVRLPSGRYLKVAAAKDSLAPERALGFLAKGVKHFYLKRESHARCVSYCDLLARQLFTHPAPSFEMRVSGALNQGEEIIARIQDEGLRPEHLDYVLSFVSGVRAVVRELKLDHADSRNAIAALVARLPAYEHAVSVTMVAGLLTLPLAMETDQALRTVGLAAFLHDLGLIGMPAEAQSEDVSRMDAEVLELYHRHPLLGAERLQAAMPDADATVVQAIAQHHERRDGSGFPGLAATTGPNRIAEIVGISGEFVQLLHRAHREANPRPLDEMKERVFHGFSYPVIEAFRRVFLK